MSKLRNTLLAMLCGLWTVQLHAQTEEEDNETETGLHGVRVHFEVLDLASIDSVAQTFDADIYYELSWVDSDLAFRGRESRVMGLDEVWDPQIQIVNQRSAQKTFPDLVEVFPDGQVVYRQRLLGRFSQVLNLKKFPFDRQILKVVMVPTGMSNDTILLQAETTSGVDDQLSIPDWRVQSWRTVSAPILIGQEDAEISSVTIEIDVDRESGFYMVKVILPLVLIVLMSFTVFWINPIHVAPQVSVSATAMLTLIAFRFSMSAMLPPVSVLTKLDLFVIYSTFLVFFALIEAVWTTGLASSGKMNEAQRIDHLSRRIFPFVFALASAHAFL